MSGVTPASPHMSAVRGPPGRLPPPVPPPRGTPPPPSSSSSSLVQSLGAPPGVPQSSPPRQNSWQQASTCKSISSSPSGTSKSAIHLTRPGSLMSPVTPLAHAAPLKDDDDDRPHEPPPGPLPPRPSRRNTLSDIMPPSISPPGAEVPPPVTPQATSPRSRVVEFIPPPAPPPAAEILSPVVKLSPPPLSPTISPRPSCSSLVEDSSAELVRLAVELEKNFSEALESLLTDYRNPMLVRLGKLASQDLDAVFKEVDSLSAASKEVLRKLKEAAGSANVGQFWLGLVYADSPGYMSAYRKFIAAHTEGLIRLNTLRSSNASFTQALGVCRSTKFPAADIDDLFWVAVSRVRHIAALAHAQRTHRHAMDELHTAADEARVFSCQLAESSSPSTALSCTDGGRKLGKSEWVQVDEALIQVDDLKFLSARLDELHSGLGLVRQILAPSPESIPPNVNRKLLNQVDVTLLSKSEFGLSTEAPAVLMLFSDGVALCVSPPAQRLRSPKYKYRLLSWYKSSLLVITSPEKKPGFTVAQKLESANLATALPPGWEEVVKGSKHVFVNKILGTTQTTRPEVALGLEGVRFVVPSSDDAKESCLKLAKELYGEGCVMSDPGNEGGQAAPSSAYVMIGSKLEELLAHEQAIFPGTRVPLLMRKIIHHIISHGLGEQGIFRVAGEKRFTDDLRQQVNSGHLASLKFEELNINLVSGLLKLFLRELPEPLIPVTLYDSFIAVASKPPEDGLEELRRLIAQFPRANAAVLKELLSFLYQIACNEHVNSMHAKNIAIVTAPNLLRKDSSGDEQIMDVGPANDVVGLMIERYTDLFEQHPPACESSLEESEELDDWVTFRRKLLGHEKGIQKIISTAGGDHMWSLDNDGVVFIWSVANCRLVRQATLDGVKFPTSAVLVGNNIWVGTQRAVHVFDSATAAPIRTIPNIVAVSFVVVGEGQDREVWCGSEGKIIILSAEKMEPMGEIPLDQSSTLVLCLAQVGDQVWSAGTSRGKAEQEIQIWDRHLRKRAAVIPSAHKKRITSLAVWRNSSVWSCSDDNTICVWSAGGKHSRLATLDRHNGAVYGFCVLQDQVWSCSWDKSIIIWDPNTHKYLGELKGYHTDSVFCLASVPAPDGSVNVWSGSICDKAICVWQVHRAPFSTVMFK